MTGQISPDPNRPRVAIAATAPALPFTPAARHQAPLRRQLGVLGAIGLVALFGLLADDWIASLGLVVLFAGLFYLTREPGPPIIAAAFSIQWLPQRRR